MALPVANRVLVLCAHTDDEMGCAATVLRLMEAGSRVSYVALSNCAESVPSGRPPGTLIRECRDCLRVLGVPEDDTTILDYRVRRFPENRQEILQTLVDLRRSLQPDLVFLPSSTDTHQDHATVHEEGFRAFKDVTMLGYEMPQNQRRTELSAFVPVSEAMLNKKIMALRCYESQVHRAYMTEQCIRSTAIVRGAQCGAAYAEAFEVIRLMFR